MVEFWVDFLKTILEGSVDHVIHRDYIVNRHFFIHCSLARHSKLVSTLSMLLLSLLSWTASQAWNSKCRSSNREMCKNTKSVAVLSSVGDSTEGLRQTWFEASQRLDPHAHKHRPTVTTPHAVSLPRFRFSLPPVVCLSAIHTHTHTHARTHARTREKLKPKTLIGEGERGERESVCVCACV